MAHNNDDDEDGNDDDDNDDDDDKYQLNAKTATTMAVLEKNMREKTSLFNRDGDTPRIESFMNNDGETNREHNHEPDDDIIERICVT